MKCNLFNSLNMLEKIVFYALELASKKSDGAEVLLSNSIGFNVGARYSQVENLEFNSDIKLDITVYHKNRVGHAVSNDFSNRAVKKAVNSALDIARYTSIDSCNSIIDKQLISTTAKDLNLYHPKNISYQQGIDLALCTEEFSLNFDSKIKKSEGSNFSKNSCIKVFGNSYGIVKSVLKTLYSLSSGVLIEDKNGSMERDYAYTVVRDIDDLKSPKWVGQESACRTLKRLSPRKISTQSLPVIFSSEVSGSLFSHLSNAISGTAIYQRTSCLQHSLGKQIFPSWLNIEENPHLLKGLGSSPFDNEGVETKKIEIVKNGILNHWLLNNYSARKLGLISNGHAGGIYTWNVVTKKPDISLEKLIQLMDTGFLVTEILGQGVDILTGNYSRGAFGFWIEGGKILHPVNGVTISGNLESIWKNIVSISSDTENRTVIRCGSVLVSEMKVAGN